MAFKLLLPTSIVLDVPARPGVELVEYDPYRAVPAEHEDADGFVAWGSPHDVLEDTAHRLHRVRWVQVLSAGTESYVAAGFRPDAVMTSGRGLHDRPVAEHALALILAGARRLHTLVRAQIGHRWAGELGGVQPEPSPGVFTTLRGARVLIWGYGGIAQTLAPHLTALGATVTGAARSAREVDGVPVIPTHRLAEELGRTDVLVMILPSTQQTAKALGAEQLALLPPHAWVVNVGRGSTLDQDALLDALRGGRLGGAALDVTSPEPLPVDSPLWDQPNLILTPHAAGGRPLGASALIAENLDALLAGRPLANVIER